MSRIAVQPAGVTDARHALLAGLLDDAGLFPPASLSMTDAVARHASDRQRRGWLIGRLLCPASRLEDLADQLPPRSGWRVGVVCDRGVEVDLLAVQSFSLGGHGVTVDAVEVRLSEPDTAAEVAALVEHIAATLEPPMAAFLEIPLRGDWTTSVPCAVAAIADARDPDLRAWPQRSLAAKVRCGGVTADAFPSVEQLATLIIECVSRGVPLKATAGLHHPLRRFDPETGATMHGFLNVVGATALLANEVVGADEVAAILAEQDPAAFTLDAESFGWRGHTLDAHAVATARASAFSGYGSCSIDEPVDDLTALGVLPLERP